MNKFSPSSLSVHSRTSEADRRLNKRAVQVQRRLPGLGIEFRVMASFSSDENRRLHELGFPRKASGTSPADNEVFLGTSAKSETSEYPSGRTPKDGSTGIRRSTRRWTSTSRRHIPVPEGCRFAHGRFHPSSVLVSTGNAVEQSPNARKTPANRTKHARDLVPKERRPLLGKALRGSENVPSGYFRAPSIENIVSFPTDGFSRSPRFENIEKNSINLQVCRSESDARIRRSLPHCLRGKINFRHM